MVTNGRGPGETGVFRGECKVHYVEEKIPVSHSLPNMLQSEPSNCARVIEDRNLCLKGQRLQS